MNSSYFTAIVLSILSSVLLYTALVPDNCFALEHLSLSVMFFGGALLSFTYGVFYV